TRQPRRVPRLGAGLVHHRRRLPGRRRPDQVQHLRPSPRRGARATGPAAGRRRMKAPSVGKVPVMSVRPQHRPDRGLTSLAVVTLAAAIFAILLVLVRLRWAPLESADNGAAARINDLVPG